MTDTPISLGMALKVSRVLRKMTSTELAAKAGISRATIWRIESDDTSVRLSSISAVCRVLGIRLQFVPVEAKDNEKAQE